MFEQHIICTIVAHTSNKEAVFALKWQSKRDALEYWSVRRLDYRIYSQDRQMKIELLAYCQAGLAGR